MYFSVFHSIKLYRKHY